MSSPTIDYDALAAQHGGSVQIDYDALAAQHGGTAAGAGASQAAAPDTRNAAQKAFDELTTVTPEQKKGHSWLTNKAQEFGAGAIQGAGAPFVHPMQTLEGVGNMIAHPIDTAESMAKSAWNNPAQALGNVTGGALLGEGAAAGADAVNGALSSAAGRAALLGKTPEEAYESALKPSTAFSQAQRARMVRTGLDEGLPISKGGVEKMGNLIDKYNQQISETINADPTRPINPSQAVQNLANTRAKFATQVNPTTDLNAIQASQDEFLNQFRSRPGQAVRNMTAQEAQEMKQGTYRVLSGKYGEQGSAAVEAQKALARGLKEEIANQFPEINQLNASESRLLDLQPVLERAVARNSNHQFIGIGTPIAGSAVKAITGSGSAGAVAAALKAALDNPMVKSRLAISLSKGAKIPYAQAAARVGAYSSALSNFSANASAPSQ